MFVRSASPLSKMSLADFSLAEALDDHSFKGERITENKGVVELFIKSHRHDQLFLCALKTAPVEAFRAFPFSHQSAL